MNPHLVIASREPHFELPLAGATSLLFHGVALGVLLLGGLAFLLRGSIESRVNGKKAD